jgi:hypothetical protein
MPLELIKIFARFEPKAVGQQTIKFDTNFPLIEAEKQIVQLLVSEISKYKTAA